MLSVRSFVVNQRAWRGLGDLRSSRQSCGAVEQGLLLVSSSSQMVVYLFNKPRKRRCKGSGPFKTTANTREAGPSDQWK